LGRQTHTAENFFQTSRGEENEHSKPRRADNKCVRPQSREEDAFPRLYVESFLSDVHVELSFQDVEEFVFSRMLMRRRFSSGYLCDKVASNKEKAPFVSCVSARFDSNIPIYHLDSSKDLARLNAFRGDDAQFIW
jgi:hypothetical protein